MITVNLMTLVTVQLAAFFLSWIFFAVAIYRAKLEAWDMGYLRGVQDEKRGLVIHFDERSITD